MQSTTYKHRRQCFVLDILNTIEKGVVFQGEIIFFPH